VADRNEGWESADSLRATYDDAFFSDLESLVEESARVIVPLVCDLLEPTSVLDVGCGRGTWLRIFKKSGVADIFGVDGPHVEEALEIPASAFRAHDLTTPVVLGRRFDLVVSLEVGEHLPAAVADEFVGSLVAHAPAVLFSAAIPFQDGPGHVHEASQSEWAGRFGAYGYVPVDVVRPAVWNDPRVGFWYAQNTLLYVDSATGERLGIATTVPLLDVVHPRLLERAYTTRVPKPRPQSLTSLLRQIPSASRRAVRRRLS
jgi:SAM-dependent methyltransferase